MRIEEIDDWIEDLENADTNADNVIELASLYIVKENLRDGIQGKVDGVSTELDDIFPAYHKYKDKRKRQQLQELPTDACISELSLLCKEIQDFIIALYSQASLLKERRILVAMIDFLKNKVNK